MENNPKKSRALIITIIIIVLFLIAGYFLFRNGGISSTNSVIGRMFSSLTPSTNTKDTKVQAGEDINKGDRVYVASTNPDGSSVVMKVNSDSTTGKILGTATSNISNGSFGKIIFDGAGGTNSFLNSFSDFLNNLFGGGNNGGGNIPGGSGENLCLNGATNPQLCTINGNGDCLNGATNPQLCTVDSNNTCLNGASNPPLCTVGNDNTCLNGATNPQLCTINGNGDCLNGASNPPLCTTNNNGSCLNGATNPQLCTVGNDNTCLNGATNPQLCTTFFDNENPQCSDKQDNDSDKLIDESDPNCHINSDLTKEYVPLHDSEINSPGTGDEKNPDLTAKETTPVVAKINTSTKLSSIITNEGGSSTGKSFSVLFRIKKITNIDVIDPINDVSKVNSKNILTNVWNKIPSISKAFAAVATDIIQTGQSTLVATVTTLASGSEKEAFVSYTFKELGTYEVQACADKKSETDAGIIKESDEDNNCSAWVSVTVSTFPGTGDEKDPDLTAGAITPIIATTIETTKLSSIISNDGGSSTKKGFSVLFTINKLAEDQSDNGNNNISFSPLKRIVVAIANKLSWFSKADAAIPIGFLETNSVTINMPVLGSKTSNKAIASYKFTSIGVYSVRACADKNSASDEGTITEFKENNNCGPWTTIKVTNSLPTGGDTCSNGADNFPECTTIGGACINGGNNPPLCTTGDCINGATDFPGCTNASQVNSCKVIISNPLTFTDKEKAELAVLLRRFYLISSTLKTNDDIVTIYNEIDQQKNFMSEIDGLTKQCYLDTNDNDGFTDFCSRNKGLCDTSVATEFASKNNDTYSSIGNKRNGNPWFTKKSGGIFPYTDGIFGYTNYNYLEGNYAYDPSTNTYTDIVGHPGCKAVAGYYYGTFTSTGGSCEVLNKDLSQKGCYGMNTNIAGAGSGPKDEFLNAGCKWKEGVFMEDTERILNIW